MCHSLLDGNGPRTNLFFHKGRLWHDARLQVWVHDDLFDVDSSFLIPLEILDLESVGISLLLTSNKRSEAAPSPDRSESVCSGFILHTPCLPCHLSPVQGRHLTLPSTAAAQEIPLRFPSPVSHPGITSKQASQQRRLTRLGQHHAIIRQPKETTTRPHEYQHRNLLPTRSSSICACPAVFTRGIFRNVKANGRGASRAASVCVSYLQARAFALCTLHLALRHPSLRPIQRGSDYRPAAESTRAPVSQSADHSTSTHPSTIARSGSGTGLTDHRSSSTSVPF